MTNPSKGEDRGQTGPRGEGHAPSVDPWKGLRGIMAGTLVLEAIVIGLVLTVIARVDDGEHFQPWKVWFVSLLAVAMLVASGLQRRTWALPLNLTLVALAVAGWAVHWSMGVCGILFAVVWAYILYLRGDLSQRIAGGYLASQHD